MKNNEWELTSNRFVVFFDILGFKDMVQKNSHKNVLDKLESLKQSMQSLDDIYDDEISKELGMELGQTKSVTFSDSIIIFSKGNTQIDAVKILVDANYVFQEAIRSGIAIKGAISYGEITVDFKKSLFFGQPIIDAYLLHDDLLQLSVIIDHNAENKISSLLPSPKNEQIIFTGEINLKYGKVTHAILKTPAELVRAYIKAINEQYSSVSGKPRIYLDNTIKHLDALTNSYIKDNILKPID